MEEFLESCRATSLLAELEDEEELPDAEEEENEEDCDDSEDCEDNYDEKGLSSQEVRNMFGKRKTWDDDHVLKRKFSALIPAFDPRPGRTNTPQTSEEKFLPAPAANLIQHWLQHGRGVAAGQAALHPHGARPGRSVPKQEDHQQAGHTDTGTDPSHP